MNEVVIQKLKAKRKEISAREGKELFMILSNATIDAMALALPQTEEELLAVKGWGPKKLQMYGKAFLEVLSQFRSLRNFFPEPQQENVDETEEKTTKPKKIKIQIGQEQIDFSTAPKFVTQKTSTHTIEAPKKEKMQIEKNDIVSVSEFLGSINLTFSKIGLVKIKGEIDDVSIRSGYAFFELKESLGGFEAEASMGCFVGWRCLEEVKHLLEAGMEVVVTGYPKIYIKNGSFRLEVTSIEPIGEGALQKAFEALKRKLQEKGYFDAERKRPLPMFIRKIGLVTSLTGAAVIDFQKNLGPAGYQVECIDVRVEGESAEESIIRAIKYLNEYRRDLDVIVLIRGGGSLQSLKAFNGEKIADAIYYSRIPVVTGIGHERDETIAGFVADLNCSTPTAVANFLRTQYESLEQTLLDLTSDLFSTVEYKIRETKLELGYESERLFSAFGKRIDRTELIIDNLHEKLRFGFHKIFITFHDHERNIIQSAGKLNTRIREKMYVLNLISEKLIYSFQKKLLEKDQRVKLFKEKMEGLNPEAILSRGYSIVYDLNGKIIKNAEDITVGKKITVRFQKGKVVTEVTDIVEDPLL